ALCRPPGRGEALAVRRREPAFLGGVSWRRREQSTGRARSGRAWRHRRFAGGLSLGRPAPPAVDRAAAHGQTADLASRRAGQHARCRRERPPDRLHAIPPRRWRSHCCGNTRRTRRKQRAIAARSIRSNWACRRASVRRGSVMNPLTALLVRDVRIALRVGGGALIGVLFFVIVVTLTPFA